MPDLELKRVLKLPAVSFIAIGFMVGGGVFVFTGIVFKIAGSALPIAYALAVIPVFISMMPLAMLGSAIPVTGASYKYPNRMVSPGLAFVGVWVYAWASFFGQIPLYALGCAGYAQTLFPFLSPTLFAVALVTLHHQPFGRKTGSPGSGYSGHHSHFSVDLLFLIRYWPALC